MRCDISCFVHGILGAIRSRPLRTSHSTERVEPPSLKRSERNLDDRRKAFSPRYIFETGTRSVATRVFIPVSIHPTAKQPIQKLRVQERPIDRRSFASPCSPSFLIFTYVLSRDEERFSSPFRRSIRILGCTLRHALGTLMRQRTSPARVVSSHESTSRRVLFSSSYSASFRERARLSRGSEPAVGRFARRDEGRTGLESFGESLKRIKGQDEDAFRPDGRVRPSKHAPDDPSNRRKVDRFE